MSDPMKTKAVGTKRAWIILHGSECVCYPSTTENQLIATLAETEMRANFHDDPLAQATSEINGIISRVMQANDDAKRIPSWIVIPGGQLMLVWAAAEHPVSADSDPAEIMEMLGVTLPN